MGAIIIAMICLIALAIVSISGFCVSYIAGKKKKMLEKMNYEDVDWARVAITKIRMWQSDIKFWRRVGFVGIVGILFVTLLLVDRLLR